MHHEKILGSRIETVQNQRKGSLGWFTCLGLSLFPVFENGLSIEWIFFLFIVIFKFQNVKTVSWPTLLKKD